MKNFVFLCCCSVLSFCAPAQSLITVAGNGTNGNGGDNGPALGAQFSNLTGVAIDMHGNIYISDAATDRVRKVDSAGNIYAYAASSTPCDVALDGAGNLYIASQGAASISKVDYITGIVSTVVTGLASPSGVVLDANGNMFIAEQTGNVISKADTLGNVTTIAGTGTGGYAGDNGLATAAELAAPYGICLDAKGNLYFTEIGNATVRKVDTAGIITTVAGTGMSGYNGDGIAANTAELSSPEGVAVDYLGNLYIADGGNDRIRIVDTNGIINTFIGSGGIINARIGFEAGLAFDPFGNLFIDNNGGYKVQEVVFPSIAVAGFSSGDTSICAGTAINFQNLSTHATSWQWYFPGATPDTSTVQNPSNITYLNPGYYNAELIAGNNNQYDTLLLNNYIHVNPAAQAGTIAAHQNPICANNRADLGLSGGAGIIQWQYASATGDSDFSAASGAEDDTLYSTPPLYSTAYYRVVTTLGACTDTSAIETIIVNPLPIPPVLSTPDSVICSADSTIIRTSGSYSHYFWNNNDTSSSIYVSTAGGYWVTVTDSNGCQAVSGHLNISAYPPLVVSIAQQGDTLSSFNSSSYQWYFNDTIIPGATGATYVVQQWGNYAVQIVDSNGCSVLSNYIDVMNPLSIYGATETGGLIIFPNPFTNTLFVEANNSGPNIERIEIYDALGRMVLSKNTSSSDVKLFGADISQLPAGTYYVAVIRNGVNNYYRQMIKL